MSVSEANVSPASVEGGEHGLVRAYWVAQGVEFLRHHFAPELRSQIELGFSSELSSALSGQGPSDWVARSHLVELLEATARARGGLESFVDLTAYGEFVERRATNRFSELLTKILTPQLSLRQLPLFFRRDHGQHGACVVDACTPGSARFHLEGVADFPHIGAVWLGWVRASLVSVGARSVELTQSGWTTAKPSAARIDFEVSWS
ncbi:MAG TPA: hypothetical protein VFK05_05965 [Polyangiaceae bacterium]|nr:hypothetical protein [Polyangiaceae bacterium]